MTIDRFAELEMEVKAIICVILDYNTYLLITITL